MEELPSRTCVQAASAQAMQASPPTAMVVVPAGHSVQALPHPAV
jgi:hypothetical protein